MNKEKFADRMLDYFSNHVLYSLSITRTNVYEKIIELMPFINIQYKVLTDNEFSKTDIVTFNFGKYNDIDIIINFKFLWEAKNDNTTFWKLVNIIVDE